MKKSIPILVVLLCCTTALSAKNLVMLDVASNSNVNEKWLVGLLCLVFFILGGAGGYLIRENKIRKDEKKEQQQSQTSKFGGVTEAQLQPVRDSHFANTQKRKDSDQWSSSPPAVPASVPEMIAEEPAQTVEWTTDHSKRTKATNSSDTVMYFPNPASGGVFRKRDGRDNFIDGASIYKFTLTAADRAEFEFCTDRSSVSIALNNRNELILSVADELTPYDPHATKLKSEPKERGKAALEGNDWIVTTKAKIRYV